MARTTLLVVVLAVLLVGCATRVGGRPLAGDEPPEPPATAMAALGDLTTIEPCGLTDPDLFAQFGTATFAVPESLDYCAISVRPNSSAEVVVTVGQLDRLSVRDDLRDSERLRDVDDELYLVQPSDDPAFCSQALVFAEDDLTLEVSVYTLSGTTTAGCEMVTTGMDRVIEVIRSGNVPHRKPEVGSLLTLDPCDLVADGTVTALPGFAGAGREDSPARHQCYWETTSGEDRLSVRVLFGAGPVPAIAGDPDATATPIAGRPTVTNPFPDAGSAAFCSVETGHIPFTEVEGLVDVVELVSVFVRTPTGQVQVGCDAAAAVAAELWPRLPAV